MRTDTARRPRGWRVRIAILWAGTAAIAAIALALLWSYGNRVVEINQAYLDSEFRQEEIDAINQLAMTAELMSRIATSLLVVVVLLAVLTLAVQARGWQLTRERARARRSDPLAH